MSSPTTNQNPGASKLQDDILIQKCGCIGGNVYFHRLGFHSFGQILSCHNNVCHPFGGMEVDLPHKIYSPFFKRNQGQRHMQWQLYADIVSTIPFDRHHTS